MIRVVEVDDSTLNAILERLGPRLYVEGVKRMMAAAAEDGRQTMEQSIDGGTGVAVRSIVAQSTANMAEIFTMIPNPTGSKIEEGRKPGDAPSLVQLARWQEGSTRRRNLEGYNREQVVELRRIQAAIKAKGSKAKRFIRNTRNQLKNTLSGYMETAARTIEAEWRKR